MEQLQASPHRFFTPERVQEILETERIIKDRSPVRGPTSSSLELLSNNLEVLRLMVHSEDLEADRTARHVMFLNALAQVRALAPWLRDQVLIPLQAHQRDAGEAAADVVARAEAGIKALDELIAATENPSLPLLRGHMASSWGGTPARNRKRWHEIVSRLEIAFIQALAPTNPGREIGRTEDGPLMCFLEAMIQRITGETPKRQAIRAFLDTNYPRGE
jgi:hypothetical protein